MKFWRALRAEDDKKSTAAQSEANFYVPRSFQLERGSSREHAQRVGMQGRLD